MLLPIVPYWTVPVNKKLLTGRVTINKELLTRTAPVINLFLFFERSHLNVSKRKRALWPPTVRLLTLSKSICKTN